MQFVREDRLEAVREDGSIEWIDHAEVARRLAALRQDSSTSGRNAGEAGQFSLAGAQPKTALTLKDGRWGVPSGRIPTTHILKPPSHALKGHAENEHLCLVVMAKMGAKTARTSVLRFEEEIAIVVERFDRVSVGDRIARLHQEDMCQALGVGPGSKYEADGGPSLARIAKDVLSRTQDTLAARRALMLATAYNFVIGGTDAHAKNYSVQIAGGGRVRLSPMYDVASYLPFTKDIRRDKMANKVGGKYLFGEVMPHHWEAEAKACGLDADDAFAPLRDMIARVPDAFSDAVRESRDVGLDHGSMDGLVDLLSTRCAKLAMTYGVEPKADADTGMTP